MARRDLSLETRADLWMPFEIARWRRDTAHLNPTEKSALLALRIYYWEHGSLPGDPARLANIAQLPLDTWSITQEALSMHFFRDSSGALHLVGDREKRAEWVSKRLKAREKAVHAINVRWEKEKAKKRALSISSSGTPSIPDVLPEKNLESYRFKEQKQVQVQPPPTPSAARRGIEAPIGELGGDTPSTPSTNSQHQAGGDTPSTPSTNSQRNGKSAAIFSEDKEKTTENALGGPAANGVGAYQQAKHGGAVRVPAKRIAPGVINGVRPTKVDPRKKEFAGQVLAYWAGQNPEHPKIEFRPADDRALDDLLEQNPSLTIAEFRRLLLNRARSEVNPAALPHKWLRNILEYASGPLGPYSKPLARSRSV